MTTWLSVPWEIHIVVSDKALTVLDRARAAPVDAMGTAVTT